jgi:predicted nucleic acid-binding protein
VTLPGLLADTGPLYAALDADDALHGRALGDTQRIAVSRLTVLVLYSTLVEAYSLVLYRLGRRIAQRWLAEVTATAQVVNPSPNDYLDARDLIHRYADLPVSLCDAALAVLSARLDRPVWTYDHHFDALRVAVWRP